MKFAIGFGALAVVMTAWSGMPDLAFAFLMTAVVLISMLVGYELNNWQRRHNIL